MTFEQFIILVENMRKEQDAFFKSDKNSPARNEAFRNARKYEKQVDDFIKNRNNQQPLFA